jgi:hypothetical protein
MAEAAERIFAHKQPVTVRRLLSIWAENGHLLVAEDWTETAQVRATKRDLRPLGYWLVEFPHGGRLCVHEANLRAA